VLNLSEALSCSLHEATAATADTGPLCAEPFAAASGGAFVAVAIEGASGAAGAISARCLDTLPQYPAPKLDDSSVANQLGLVPALVTSSEPPPPPPSGPALGSEGLPSSGSVAHADGGCRPCAFLHTKGCENGLSCSFCHLCGPEEKRRRRKEKLEMKRVALSSGPQGLPGSPDSSGSGRSVGGSGSSGSSGSGSGRKGESDGPHRQPEWVPAATVATITATGRCWRARATRG
jgi:hypothetical protein